MIQRNDKVTAVHLRIELMYVKPAIWRQVSVPDDLSLGDLHTVIQIIQSYGFTKNYPKRFDFSDHKKKSFYYKLSLYLRY